MSNLILYCNVTNVIRVSECEFDSADHPTSEIPNHEILKMNRKIPSQILRIT